MAPSHSVGIVSSIILIINFDRLLVVARALGPSSSRPSCPALPCPALLPRCVFRTGEGEGARWRDPRDLSSLRDAGVQMKNK